MRTSRRGLLRLTGYALVAGTAPLCLAACSGHDSTELPKGWSTHIMEPLTIPVPEGLVAWTQDTGSASFYWDRCWAANPDALSTSTVVLARLWGQGAVDDASPADGVACLSVLVGAQVTVGDIAEVGGGSWRQELSSQAGKGVLWNLVNGVSRAVVILFGPDIDDDAVSGFGGSLVLAKEPSLDAPPAGWQRRQASGVSVLVGADWNDIGTPSERGDGGGEQWTRGWILRSNSDVGTARAVMAGSNLPGASLSEAASAFVDNPGITNLRDSSVTAFSAGGLNGQRVDFTWGGEESLAGCVWLVRVEDVNKGVMYLRWGAADSGFESDRTAMEAAIALV